MFLFELSKDNAPPFLPAVLFIKAVSKKMTYFASSSTFIAPPLPAALLFINKTLSKTTPAKFA